ncbi:complement C1q and tumor necrosis factor-related protein 9A [Gadus macrocephalus]|uniref:complement C1q and tumor necrosis factor-related protein 9A n=1 Tax=Gadus macrocephalus TaxID=80720 RepID=UPI0028CB90C5|nr:complement C1q and tumor necrosis factor-related protein 9A [Gadus macrocephalus]
MSVMSASRRVLPGRLCVTLFLLLLAARCVAQENPLTKGCGYPGIPGDPGHNGMPGRDGRDGLRGDKGDRGEIGVTGQGGKDGNNGEKGESGGAGPSGLKGKKGEHGERGAPGKMGPQGVLGPLGLKGIKGEFGPPGPRGPKGDIGPLGPEGSQGEVGPRGDRGIQGALGPPGRPGPKGDLGVPGHKGNIGYRGERGGRGDVGEKGQKGDTVIIPKSAFTVGLTEQTKQPPPDAPIRFNKIIYNLQNHYDPETGRFTCAVAGAYYFSYHITVFARNVKVALVKNGVKFIHTHDVYQSGEDQAAGGAVLNLAVGDKVWLQVVGGELYNGLFADEDDDTTFSGFLIFGA